MIQKPGVVWSCASLALLVLTWQLAAQAHLTAVELSSPAMIITYLQAVLLSGTLARDISTTSWRISIGLTGGIGLGILLGLLTGRSPLLNRLVGPLINVVRSLPPVALLTLFVALLGSTDVMRVTAILTTSIFSVYVNTHTGAASVPIEYIRTARLLNSSPWQRLVYVILPAALPFVLTGVRLSIATGFVVAYVGETAGTSMGLGFQIVDAQNSFQYARMMAYLLVLGGLAACTDYVVRRLASFLFPWLTI